MKPNYVFAALVLAAGSAIPEVSEAAVTQDVVPSDGAAVAHELYKRNLGYVDMSATLEMKLRNAQGQESDRMMRFRAFERGDRDKGDYSLVVFDTPSDVKGTALLSHAGVLEADQQWLYMPALERTRRISSRNTSGPFMGSEFSYEDITGNEVDKYSWKLLGSEACGAIQCVRVETRPKYDRSGYTRRVMWIDTVEYRVHRVEFYDRKDVKFKTLTYARYRQYKGKYWRAHEWTMKNHQTGKSTVLAFSDFKFGNGFSERDFSNGALDRVK